jgi:hypothetical protein
MVLLNIGLFGLVSCCLGQLPVLIPCPSAGRPGGGPGSWWPPRSRSLVKLHWRVVCPDGLPGMLWNLQGWSSITSMVYLSLLNLSPLRF